MKILVMNNNIMYEDQRGFYIYKETGKFFAELHEIEHEVNVFQFSEQFRGNNFLADYNLKGKGLKISNIRRSEKKIFAFLKASMRGANEVRKADFVYLFYPGNICTLIGFYAFLLRKPFGLYVRGEQKILAPLSKFLYRKASFVLTISPKFTEIISNLGGKAETIRPMMAYNEKDIVRDRTYPSKRCYSLLFVGRIERAKGVFEIVNALSYLVNNSTINFKMNFIGDGPDTGKIKAFCQQKNLCEFVTFHGTITDKKELETFYKSSDLFVFPSHHEGFPRVLYEAMIFGVPILTTFVGSISSLMVDKKNCYQIKKENSENVEALIKMFLENYEKVACVAEKGTETINEYLSDKKLSHSRHLHYLIFEKNG